MEGVLSAEGLASAPVEVHAERGGEVVASSPVAADGGFLLAVSLGRATRFTVVGEDGRVLAMLADDPGGGIPVPVEVEICKPSAPLDMGEVRAVQGGCYPSDACLAKDLELRLCEEDRSCGPRDVWRDGGPVMSCDEACRSELRAFAQCQGSRGGCRRESDALLGCFARTGCADAGCCDEEFREASTSCRSCEGAVRAMRSAAFVPRSIGCE